MTIEEFYKSVLTLMPYCRGMDRQFYERLQQCLESYGNLVEGLSIDGNPINPETKQRIKTICSVMSEIVTLSMAGRPSAAFAQLDALLTGNNGQIPRIKLEALVLHAKKGKNFYRVREMTKVQGTVPEDLYHIPITSRGMVKTHRYSIPGYPCLYLGESIYGCWEEMRRPPMHQCAVARYRSENDICLIDLRIPTEKKLRDETYLELMPLVMACMIKVADDHAIYKPEYIIPQLLMEWVIMHRTYNTTQKKYPVYGVVYHSTQLNNEFDFPMEKFINFAIPVFKVNEKYKYCPKLCETFSLTKPTTNEQEKLKGAYKIYIRQKETENERKENNFLSSDFGQLESRLKDEEKYPLVKIQPGITSTMTNYNHSDDWTKR